MPAEVEVPLGSSVAGVPIPVEVEVPLGPGAAAVEMAAAEPSGGEVLLRPTAPLPRLLQVPCSVPSLPGHSPHTAYTNEEQTLHKLTM
jgi:hypothetical protein